LNEEGSAEAIVARIATPRLALVSIFMGETWRLRGGRRTMGWRVGAWGGAVGELVKSG